MRVKSGFFCFFYIHLLYMKQKLYLLCGILLLPLLVGAQESFNAPKVNEDAFLVQKEISTWRTDKANNSKVAVYNCQAVRLSREWFLTAAHCVYNACRDGLPCTVQITLAEGEMRQLARVNHTTTSKTVFIYPNFFPGQNRISSVDVALVKLSGAEYFYDAWDSETKQWLPISRKEFEKQLSESPETKAQLNAAGARLIGAVNLPSARFLPQVVVPKMTDGSLSYLGSVGEVFFVKELQHFIAPDFGVRRGNSGGGIFTPSGDLVGVVSSLLYTPNGSASFKNDDGQTLVTLQNARDYFLFTGFNGATLNFIRSWVPDLRVIGAENGFVEPTEQDFKTIIKNVNQSSLAM